MPTETGAVAPREVAPAAALPCQSTLARPFALEGRGLHTGRRGRALVRPATGGGIVFRRGGDRPDLSVAALLGETVPQPLCTALRYPGGGFARTVEHLVAALSAHAIDHVAIDLDAEELPIFDGSAVPWCEAIASAGRRELPRPRRHLRVLRPVSYACGRHRLSIEPADVLSLDVRIALAHFGPMRWAGTVTPEVFDRELAPARSFGRLKWALPAKLYGLATRRPVLRGATFASTAAIVGGRIVGGMRLPDEPVRHRALDLVGDLALAGHPVLGHVTAKNPGHDHNHGLLRALLAEPESWTLE